MLSRHRACALQAASTPWGCSKAPGAVLVYGSGILNNNWLEERLRPSNVALEPRRARRHDSEFVHSDRDAVVRLSRAPHYVSYAWPDDGYDDQWQTTSMADFKDPEQRSRESRACTYDKGSVRDAWNSAQGASELKSFGPAQRSRMPARCSSWSTTSKDFYGYASREAASPSADSLVDQQRVEQARSAMCVRARRSATDIASLEPELRARRRHLGESSSAQHQTPGDSPQAKAPCTDERESRLWGAGASGTPEWQEYLAERSGYLFCPSTSITRSVSAARRKGLTFQDD